MIGQGSVWRISALFILGLVAAACGANTEPLVIVSTIETPLVSPTPSQTLPPTPTIAISPTVTLAPTDTPVQPTASGAEPTSPLLPTRTLAPATQTATFQPEQAGLEIEYFITNDELLTPGSNATLFWRVVGASRVRIFRLNADDLRTQVWDVDTEGRLTVSIDITDEDVDGVRFLLQAEAPGGSVAEEILTVQTDCPFAWFFQPPPGECPDEAPRLVGQVEQRFENGMMIWMNETREIYVLYDDEDNPAWQRFEDRFEEGAPDRDDAIIPPPERLQPVRGFGLIWRENPDVRERLGWAVEVEVGYDGIIQTSDGEPGTIYVRVLEGGILSIAPNGENWEILPFFVPTETPELTPTGTQAEPTAEQ